MKIGARKRKLDKRIAAHAAMRAGGSDGVSKRYPEGYRRPGSMKK